MGKIQQVRGPLIQTPLRLHLSLDPFVVVQLRHTVALVVIYFD